jgi:high-affinity iron transporter
MIFWMRRHARAIRGELHQSLDQAMSTGSSVRLAIAFAAFFAVLREGLEAVLFMIATAITEDRGAVIIGALAGLAVASLLGYAVVLGGRKMPMRQFFTVTGVMLIIFAAGLLARAVMFLQTAGDLPIIWNNIYDLTGIDWLTTRTEVGRFLGAMFGWDPRPSIEQAIVWLGYVGTVTYLFLRKPRSQQPAPQTPAPQPVAAEKQVTT